MESVNDLEGPDRANVRRRPGLIDMVFTTNAATAWGDKALVARFGHPQRAAEAAIYLDWFRARGYATRVPYRNRHAVLAHSPRRT